MTAFGDDRWRELADHLSGASLRWWKRHRDTVVELGRDEAGDMLVQLARRQPYAAQVEIVARMDRAQWIAYRDGVTEKLSGIAKRRAEMLDALRELGWVLARVLGRQLERAL